MKTAILNWKPSDSQRGRVFGQFGREKHPNSCLPRVRRCRPFGAGGSAVNTGGPGISWKNPNPHREANFPPSAGASASKEGVVTVPKVRGHAHREATVKHEG